MKLYDFLDMCIEYSFPIHVWDFDKQAIIFDGLSDEIPDEIRDATVDSYDPIWGSDSPEVFTINVSFE